MPTDPPEPHDPLSRLELAALLNTLRGDVSFDRLAEAVNHRIKSPTIQRMCDPSRPYETFVLPSSLVTAAEAINAATTQRTTPWALAVAHLRQIARVNGIWGEPSDRELAALTHLPRGWADLAPDRLSTWNRVGEALTAEQEADAGEVHRLRAQVAGLEARLARKTPQRPARPHAV